MTEKKPNLALSTLLVEHILYLLGLGALTMPREHLSCRNSVPKNFVHVRH